MNVFLACEINIQSRQSIALSSLSVLYNSELAMCLKTAPGKTPQFVSTSSSCFPSNPLAFDHLPA